MIKFVIYGRLSGLNEYTKACRSNRFAGAKLKKDNEELIMGHLLEQVGNRKIDGKVVLNINWYEPNSRRDPDNVCFAKKFILDTLVKAGVINGDEWSIVMGFKETFSVDKDNPRIEVEVAPYV